MEFVVTYTARDVLLYATAIGFGADARYSQADLPFCWEGSPDFTVVPTWATTLHFWATSSPSNIAQQKDSATATTTTGTLPSFPPPTMKTVGLLPRHCLRDPDDSDNMSKSIQDYPILHTRQIVTWNQQLKEPRSTASYRLRSRVVAVQPKSVGTFCTTQIDLFNVETTHDNDNNNDMACCTLQFTGLILGLDPELVIPWQAPDMTNLANNLPTLSFNHVKQQPTYIQRIKIPANQALVYRLASGDTNAIHVDPTANPLGESNGDGDDDNNNNSKGSPCILHGLCTLGIVTRVIIQQSYGRHGGWKHLQAQWTHPICMGDTIEVQLWETTEQQMNNSNARDDATIIYFRVMLPRSGKVAVDRGVVVLNHIAQSKL